MNVLISYCAGLHQGDGSLGINRTKRYSKKKQGYTVHEYEYCTFCSTDLELVEIFKKTFRVDNEIIVSKDKRKETYKAYYRLNTHNKELISFLKSIGYGYNKTVDVSKLKESLKGYEYAFVRGMIDTDGCVTMHGKQKSVDICSNDMNVTQFVCDTLSSLGIEYAVYSAGRKTCTLYTVRVRKDIDKVLSEIFKDDIGIITRKHSKLIEFVNL